MIKYSLILLAISIFFQTAKIQAQNLLNKKVEFTRQDTLRGSITTERAWWDLTYYHLDVKVDPDNKFI